MSDVNLGSSWRIDKNWCLLLVGQTRLAHSTASRQLSPPPDNNVGQIQKVSCTSRLGGNKNTVGFKMTVKVTSPSGKHNLTVYTVASKHMKENHMKFPGATEWKKVERKKKDGQNFPTHLFFSLWLKSSDCFDNQPSSCLP